MDVTLLLLFAAFGKLVADFNADAPIAFPVEVPLEELPVPEEVFEELFELPELLLPVPELLLPVSLKEFLVADAKVEKSSFSHTFRTG